MDTILTEENFIEENCDENSYSKASMWLKEGDKIYPSINVQAFKKLTPGVYTIGGGKEVFLSQVTLQSDELGTFSNNKVSFILNEIKTFWDKKPLYESNNLVHKRGILLEGYPGVGKSATISLVAKDIIALGGIVFLIKSENDFPMYCKFLSEIFRAVEPKTPVVTILEDLDKYGDFLTMLNDFLDGKSHINYHVVIATTNNSEAIPDSVTRPSRIDLRVEFPYPTAEIRKEFLLWKKIPEELVEEMVSKTDSFSMADLKELFISTQILEYSIDDAIAKIKTPIKKKNYTNIRRESSRIGF